VFKASIHISVSRSVYQHNHSVFASVSLPRWSFPLETPLQAKGVSDDLQDDHRKSSRLLLNKDRLLINSSVENHKKIIAIQFLIKIAKQAQPVRRLFSGSSQRAIIK
jgi:hypothetical protein